LAAGTIGAVTNDLEVHFAVVLTAFLKKPFFAAGTTDTVTVICLLFAYSAAICDCWLRTLCSTEPGSAVVAEAL
jgi:hypothetical protein